MARRGLVVVFFVACVSPKAPQFLSYVTQTAGSGDTTFDVAPSGSGLEFAITLPTTGNAMPLSMKANAMELLPDTRPECTEPLGIGVGVLPVVEAVPPELGGSSPVGLQTPSITAGPALVQATVPWSATYLCDGSSATTPQVLSGTSTITVFPSGRIARTDTMVQGTMTAAGPANCGCDMNNSVGSFELSTFWSFVVGSDVSGSDAPAMDGQQLGCTLYEGVTVGVAFSDNIQTHHDNNGDQSVYRRDFEAGTAIDNTVQTSYRSAMQITDAPTCTDTAPLLAATDLELDGAVVPIIDDLYTLVTPVDHELDFTASGSGTIPPGFALALALGDHAAIEIDHAPTDFAVQPGSDGLTIIYIVDGLGPADVLSVTPE